MRTDGTGYRELVLIENGQARTGGGLESSGEVSVASSEIVDLFRKGGHFAYIMKRALNLAYAIRVLAILSASAATR